VAAKPNPWNQSRARIYDLRVRSRDYQVVFPSRFLSRHQHSQPYVVRRVGMRTIYILLKQIRLIYRRTVPYYTDETLSCKLDELGDNGERV